MYDIVSSLIYSLVDILNTTIRYACLVCRHRPIFDTIAMLSVHRTGQRHIRGAGVLCISSSSVYSIVSNYNTYSYVCIAAHLVLQQRQKDREELEKRDQLKQLKKRVQEMVC